MVGNDLAVLLGLVVEGIVACEGAKTTGRMKIGKERGKRQRRIKRTDSLYTLHDQVQRDGINGLEGPRRISLQCDDRENRPL